MRSASDLYENAIKQGDLPAIVPVQDDDGNEGTACVTFDPSSNPFLRQASRHEDCRVRAVVALYACQAARDAVDSQMLGEELHAA